MPLKICDRHKECNYGYGSKIKNTSARNEEKCSNPTYIAAVFYANRSFSALIKFNWPYFGHGKPELTFRLSR